MRKNIIFLTILLISIHENRIFCQPIIEQEDILPRIGDTYSFEIPNGSTSIAQIKGEDVTWNFAYDPISINTQHIVIKDPSNTPYYASFPDADFCEVSVYEGSTYINYSYQGEKDGKLEEKGNVFAFPSIANYAYYDDYHALMQYPVQYGDSMRDVYHGTATYSKEIFPRHGERNCIVDGYGTLIYSTGDTLKDVLRISCYDYYVDSMQLRYDSVYSHTISWYKSGIRAPLVFQKGGGFWSYTYADQSISGGGGVFYKYLDPSYIHDQLTAIDQIPSSTESDFVVFPNP